MTAKMPMATHEVARRLSSLQLLNDNPKLFCFVTQNRLLTEARPGEPTPAASGGAVTAVLTEALG